MVTNNIDGTVYIQIIRIRELIIFVNGKIFVSKYSYNLKVDLLKVQSLEMLVRNKRSVICCSK